MATCLSHHLFCVQSLHHQFICFCDSTNPQYKSSLLSNPNRFLRLRNLTVLKSSPHESPSSSLEPSVQESKTAISVNPNKSPVALPTSDSSFNSFFFLLRRLREGLKVDELGSEILSIALPAALALAADPITSLVDTAFVGHLGSVELAAVGVSVSVFNLILKVFNVPLLNITTSFVAEEQALIAKSDGESHQIDHALAAGIGIAEALALFVGSGFLMNAMGIPAVRLS
ncbi:hypothetical protein U1Q18_022487 [Sarracenia purpurea var. burkii]